MSLTGKQAARRRKWAPSDECSVTWSLHWTGTCEPGRLPWGQSRWRLVVMPQATALS